MGEVTAAVVSGRFIADGPKVIGVRSRLMSRWPGGRGGVVAPDADATDALIADYPGVEVAGYLSPRQTVVVGPGGAPVDALIGAPSAQNACAPGQHGGGVPHRPDGSDPARTAFRAG